MRRAAFRIALLLFAHGLTLDVTARTFPSRPRSGHWCGTSEQNNLQIASFHRWNEDVEPGVRSRAAANQSRIEPILRNGMFFHESVARTTRFMNSFDLENTSVRFSRTDTQRFTVARSPLEYEADLGSLLRDFEGTVTTQAYQIRSFDFPFHDQSYRSLTISRNNAIFFGTPATVSFDQWTALEAVLQRDAVIAPLFLTPDGSGPSMSVFVREAEDRVVFTFQTPTGSRFHYDIQATLFRSGDIRFSYKTIGNQKWGAVLVTSGREPWRREEVLMSSASGPSGNVDPVFPEANHPQLDLIGYSVSRVADSNVLRFRVRLAAPLDRSRISSVDPIQYFIDLSDGSADGFGQIWGVEIFPEGHGYYVPGRGYVRNSPAVSIEGDTITLDVLQDYFDLDTTEIEMLVYTSILSMESIGDQIAGRVTFAPASSRAQIDISSEPSSNQISRPIVEAFTLPTLDPLGVWKELEWTFDLEEENVDGLAIYQSFFTDIIFYAGAYSTVGNSGANGISYRARYGSDYDREPALLHMNQLDYGWNESSQGSSSVSLHEFGHHWLYQLKIREGSENTHSLNPVSDHPAQYVHTPAAFPVYSASDYSTMGGSRFSINSNGTFTSAPDGAFGYSWTDLYLMGLASPAEVAPWFYIKDSNPKLGDAYDPPPQTTVSGTKVDVAIQQVIDALGPRTPAMEQAQRKFTVYFILLTEPGRSPTDAEVVALDAHRKVFEENFKKATGGRGEVVTQFGPIPPPAPPPAPPARRRAARRGP